MTEMKKNEFMLINVTYISLSSALAYNLKIMVTYEHSHCDSTVDPKIKMGYCELYFMAHFSSPEPKAHR